jgi:RNA polymerase sigma factor (sigma-70 family)
MEISQSLDHNTFTAMYNRLYNKVYSYIRLRVSNVDDVEDITQEVFLSAFRSWKEMPDDTVAKHFLFIIARSRMIDFYKSAHTRYSAKAKVEGMDDVVDPLDTYESNDPLPQDIFIKNENSHEVTKILNNLSGIDREIIVLRFMEEMSYEEISEVLQINIEAGRKKVSRILDKIRKDKQK